MIRLTREQIFKIYSQLMRETGGAEGIRDMNLPDSALNVPFQSFAGEDVYPSLRQKAARLCYGPVKNHPFIDGNKRPGAHAMPVFPALNGVELSYAQEELTDTILNLAEGAIGFEELSEWILSNQL